MNKPKNHYRVTVPETGEVFTFASTMEINFVGLVHFPREEGTYHNGEKWVREGGWALVKKSKTYDGAAYLGQTKKHAEYMKQFPHVVVPTEIDDIPLDTPIEKRRWR